MTTITDSIPVQLTRKDFVSDQTVRWCPGCGDYSVLAQMQKTMPEIGVPREKIVFISGIGCSSRFPYYMNTYGIHSIHGRAPTLATGLKITNPELSVWVITGDGDGLSIGGNHLVHTLRRNIDINIVLFNNRVYGLTKGQYSPTSRQGYKSKSSPMGTIERPVNPITLALASPATFVARSLDAHPKHLGTTLAAAAAHKGGSFIEVYQNCIIFNPQEWTGLDNRRTRDDNIIYLEHGKPMVFGQNQDKGIRLNKFQPEVVQLGNGVTEKDLILYDVTSLPLALMISSMEFPDFPAPLGIFYQVDKPTYGEGLMEQIETAQAQRGVGDLDELYRSAEIWTIEAPAEEEVDTSKIEAQLSQASVSILSTNTLITIPATASVAAAIETMTENNIGCLLVMENGDMVGIFTERDVLNRVAGQAEDPTQLVVADFMTADPVTAKADITVATALNEMSEHGFRHLPLVDENDRVTGIVSFRDVVNYMQKQLN